MDISESPDLTVLFSAKGDKCVVFSQAGSFLFERAILKDSSFSPEELYSSFFSPFPYSYLKECLVSCTTIAIKQTVLSISKCPVTIIACGGEAGYKELGEFRP